MILFRRRRAGRHAEDGDVFTPSASTDVGDEDNAFDDYLDDISDAPEAAGEEVGPYDSADERAADAVEVAGREPLDLGSLRLPMVAGVEIRGRVNPRGQMIGVLLVAGDSQLELTVLAAPRTEGIWDEIRADLSATITRQGGSLREVPGPRGVELRGTVPGPQGGTAPIRVLGVDGPRWFVQAVFAGRAAAEPDPPGPLQECLDRLVVHRDSAPRPVREPLPLQLPQEVLERAQAKVRAARADGDPE